MSKPIKDLKTIRELITDWHNTFGYELLIALLIGITISAFVAYGAFQLLILTGNIFNL